MGKERTRNLIKYLIDLLEVEGEVADNASLLLISLYKDAEVKGWNKIMELIEATGIDLHN